MIRLRLSLVSEKSYNRLGCGFISKKKKKEKHCICGGGGYSKSAMSVVCTLSICADFITAPEGENSNRPLLHLMPV